MNELLIAIALFFVSFACSLLAPRAFAVIVIAGFATDLRFAGHDSPVSFSLQEILVYGFLFAFFVRGYRIYRSSFKTSVSKVVLLYTVLMVISTVPNLGEDPTHMLSVIRDTVVPFLWFIVFLNFILFVGKDTAVRYFNVFVIIGIISGLLGFVQHFFHQFVFFNEELNRGYLSVLTEGSISYAFPATGFFSYFNAYGLFEQMSLLIALVGVFYSNHRRRSLYLLASAILLMALYFSFSRGSYLSLIVAILVGLSVGGRRFKGLGYAVGASIVGMFFGYILPFFLNNPKQLATLLLRFQIWQTGYVYFVSKSNWLYGMGPGMFVKLVGTNYDVHNEYLMHLFENGIIGFAALGMVIAVLLRESYRLFQKSKPISELASLALSCYLIFVGYFVQEFVEHSFSSIIFRLIIFTFAALLVKANQDFNKWEQANSKT